MFSVISENINAQEKGKKTTDRGVDNVRHHGPL